MDPMALLLGILIAGLPVLLMAFGFGLVFGASACRSIAVLPRVGWGTLSAVLLGSSLFGLSVLVYLLVFWDGDLMGGPR